MAPKATKAVLLQDHPVRYENGFKIKGYTLEVPVDYDNQSKWREHSLKLRCDVVCGRENDEAEVDIGKLATKNKGLVLYLCGGPGSENPAAQIDVINSYFLGKGFYPFYMDYRGCGESTPFNKASLQAFSGPQQAAEYLQNFNFPDIARDYEAVRRWVGDRAGRPIRWRALGQSYGGWVAFAGVSHYPDGWAWAATTGGTPPLLSRPDEVYAETFRSVVARNDEFYAAYPDAEAMVRELAKHIYDRERQGAGRVRLPGGGVLTAQRFMSLGRSLGKGNGLAEVYGLVRAMHREMRAGGFEPATLRTVESWIQFDARPLYAVLHEAIYCNGRASRWSAERVGLTTFGDKYWWVGGKGFEGYRFDAGRLYFSGEHVFPWAFDAFAGLGGGLKEVAEILTRHKWPHGFDAARLQKNAVPIRSVVYTKDMYVSRELSMKLRTVPNLTLIEDTQHFHAAIKDKTAGPLVLDQLIGPLLDQ